MQLTKTCSKLATKTLEKFSIQFKVGYKTQEKRYLIVKSKLN